LKKKSKILMAVAMIFIVSVLSANLSASPMHHMDDSDCFTQTSCNNCFVSSSTAGIPVLAIPFPFCYEFSETINLFESNISVPAPPPPKN